MFGYESKLKLKELLLFIAEQELAIEKMRQILAAIRDFEPYAAFKRVDRNNTGFIGTKEICQFERENGYREVSPEDFIFMISYFDLDSDGKLNYHDFLQVLLPCDNPYLRSAATQRPNQEVFPNEFLPMRVERAMSQLIYKEVKMHLKAENIKRSLESSYDFSVRAAFKAVDDWNYGYIDKQNLKRFLRSMGHLATKQEIVAILRRFDLDGDAKINMQEFGEAIKTQLAATRPVKLRNMELEAEKASKASRSASVKSGITAATRKRHASARYEQHLGQPSPRRSLGSTVGSGILKSGRKKSRPNTANRMAGVYDPSRQMAMHQKIRTKASPVLSQGVNYAPFEVPNAARVPVVSANQGFDMPPGDDVNPGQLYADRGGRGGGSPLRQQSPRRPSGPPLEYKDRRYGGGNSYSQLPRENGAGSPLRQKSPTGGMAPEPMISDMHLARNSYTAQPESRRMPPQAQVAGNIGQYDRVEQAEFAKVLKDNIFLERELESQRVELALKTDFNLLDAFKIFDQRGTGNISVQDVIIGLREILGFDKFSHDDVYLLFRRHDANQDGKLNFTEFSALMLPISKEYGALLTDRPDFYMSRGVPITKFFNHDTRDELRNCWAAMFKCERACEVLRASLRARPYFNIKSAFQHMDRQNRGYVSVEDLREFLGENGFFATERELVGLVAKADRTGDGRVSFNEFVDEFSPKLGM